MNRSTCTGQTSAPERHRQACSLKGSERSQGSERSLSIASSLGFSSSDAMDPSSTDRVLRKCRLLVVKSTERCNLNCSYCYMYNGGDQSYLSRPPVMSMQTARKMFERVDAHCRRHNIREFAFVLHGGEPLVAPPKYYREFVASARELIDSGVNLRFALQTNGTLMDEAWCDAFKELGIKISFSLDGPAKVNDAFRVDRKGRGSFDRVMAGWRIAESQGIRPGLLMVIDPGSDPAEVYDLIKKLNPSTADFLFPDATHDKPSLAAKSASSPTPYADWLLQVFKLWTFDGEHAPNIRLFLQLMRSMIGGNYGYDVLGQGDIEVLVIESDGEIQPLDGLRFCEDGLANTPYSVYTHALDDAYAHDLIATYHDSHSRLCTTCSNCRVKSVCGGGFLAHRYARASGFDNPSVYCQDLYKLISHLYDWLSPRLPARERARLVDLSRGSTPEVLGEKPVSRRFVAIRNASANQHGHS